MQPAGYYNVIAGPNIAGWTRGYLTVTATNTTLSGTWTSAQGGQHRHLHHHPLNATFLRTALNRAGVEEAHSVLAGRIGEYAAGSGLE